VLTITLLTFKEVIRRRIILVTSFLALVFLALFGTGVHYGYKEMAGHVGPLETMFTQQFLALGLYFGSFIVAFLAIMAVVGAVSGEIESGTIYAIVPRPLKRSAIILGKLLGYGLMLCAFAALFYIAVILIIRFNTGLSVPVQPAALGLFCLQPLILLAVSLFGTTFLSTLANGIAAFMLYAIGVIGGMMEQIGHLANSEVLIQIGIVSSLVMPADAIYRKIVYSLMATPGISTASMLGPFGSMSEPSAWMLLYTGLYILCFLALAVKIFSKKDL
jgi:ABC-type transport system involved in multi-copper enzyme maturation permease subunit